MARRTALIVVASMIFSLGLVMIFNTTSAEILDLDLDRSHHVAIFRQLIFAALGWLLALFLGKLGVRRFIRYSPAALFLFTMLLALCFVPGVGKVVNGSSRWIALSGLSFQPSEFVKFVIPAFFINRLGPSENRTLGSLLRALGWIAIPMGLILLEPNNGTVAVILVTLAALCALLSVPMKYWAAPLLVIMLIGSVAAWQLPYVRGRLQVYLNPDLDVRGRGHQPLQAKIAAGSGKLLGKGPGNSLQKLSYLPEAQNDYIAAIYAEEFGFVGMMSLIALYLGITYLGFSAAYHAVNPDEALLAASIMFLISFQAFMNLGVVSGLLPSTGLNLPLFSQGGTSLIANILGIALMYHVKTKENDEKAHCDQRRRVGRTPLSRASAG